jgi:hypothetical protein
LTAQTSVSRIEAQARNGKTKKNVPGNSSMIFAAPKSDDLVVALCLSERALAPDETRAEVLDVAVAAQTRERARVVLDGAAARLAARRLAAPGRRGR